MQMKEKIKYELTLNIETHTHIYSTILTVISNSHVPSMAYFSLAPSMARKVPVNPHDGHLISIYKQSRLTATGRHMGHISGTSSPFAAVNMWAVDSNKG